ncbi:alpha/beta fold hydrolase [Corynebacterium heidelbergense]|uniref:AB hydrolase-1 domain-containing protein n=1 Tax=Corynebacterium heidelbergense TaxID=2055947 RepID=A0A364V4A4_9CORY|nr:alpha/beta fold hydrolase [Corynebacterium heidelbergense]RAV31462.1 hypothetical protein DLJ54_08215 [Corynebacterium heidelbergense]
MESPTGLVGSRHLRALDLLIVGAGLSGVDMAYHVSRAFPDWRWEVHDTHAEMGGTWHTFRYPGIRSDSDMASFGFPFRPWTGSSTLGRGAEIMSYLREVAEDATMTQRLHTCSFIRNVDWRSERGMWLVTAVRTNGEPGDVPESTRPGVGSADPTARAVGQTERFWAKRVHFASGYYSHGRGHRPEFPGEGDFTGQIIHPQAWPDGLDVRGKRVVLIGSGATAVTMLPVLVDLGADVTMLQRTPSYIAPLPEKDAISAFWKRLLPARWAGRVARLNHATRDEFEYLLAQHAPKIFAGELRRMQRKFISAEEIERNFTPPYKPWDQRVCKAPDGDFFRALAGSRARVVTDRIERFTRRGVEVASGREIDADIIVTATGLELQAFGGGTVSLNGVEQDPAEHVVYRGMMVAGLPNFSFTVGYINASWTLRADLVSRYMVKLWKAGHSAYTPVLPPGRFDRHLLEFDAGYIRRGVHRFPRQGDSAPWVYEQNYLAELRDLGFGDQEKDMAFDDDALAQVGRARPAPCVETVDVGGPYVEPDMRSLPPCDYVRVNDRVCSTAGRPVRRGDGQGCGGDYACGGPRVRVRVREGAPGCTDTVVLIHGVGRSLDDFDDTFAVWQGEEQLVAVDLPGFGFSDPLTELSMETVSRAAWEAVDAVTTGEETCHLVGNSLGGAVVMEMAVQRPTAVGSVTLVDSAAFGTTATWLLRLVAIPLLGQSNAWAMRIRPIYGLVERVSLRRPGAVTKRRVDVTRRVVRHAARPKAFYGLVRQLGSPLSIRSDWQDDLIERFRAVVRPSEGVASDDAGARSDGLDGDGVRGDGLDAGAKIEDDSAAATPRRGIPVWVVWGEDDKVLSYSQFRTALENVQPDVATVFNHCGHMPQLEYPKEFAERLERFIRRG